MEQERRRVLPPAVYDDLVRIDAQLDHWVDPKVVQSALAGLRDMPAATIAAASSEIVYAARLTWWRNQRVRPIWHVFRPARPELDNLRDCPSLAWILIFHQNGRIREASLHALKAPPDSPFFLAAIIQRLNDWAEPVRSAAVRYANRFFPSIQPALAAGVALTLLSRYLTWGRWQVAERSVLDRLFGRTDVVAALAERFRLDTIGPLATCLRHALRYPAMDKYLSVLAREAVQPTVRATAFECLVRGNASWLVGFGWEWEDKVFNKKRKVALFEERKIDAPPLEVLIREGLMDRSVCVRRVTADAVIANRRDIQNIDELTQTLSADASPSIRERADYLRRHREL